jgi:uncharacterized protein YggU (UPF0235/DUF167 family)
MHTELWKAADDGAIELNVHAQPGAGRTHIAGRHGTALKVRVAAPPEQGRSNEALVKDRLERLVAEEPAGPASGRRGSPPGGKVKRR